LQRVSLEASLITRGRLFIYFVIDNFQFCIVDFVCDWKFRVYHCIQTQQLPRTEDKVKNIQRTFIHSNGIKIETNTQLSLSSCKLTKSLNTNAIIMHSQICFMREQHKHNTTFIIHQCVCWIPFPNFLILLPLPINCRDHLLLPPMS
jgi:hypothetical protein